MGLLYNYIMAKEYIRPEWKKFFPKELISQWERINECKFLTLAEKFVLDQIASLSFKQGFCNASNEWMAENWGCTEKNIERHIRELYRMGFIKKEEPVFRQRRITIDWGMVDLRKSEKRKGSPFTPATIKHFERVLGEEGVPKWRADRKLYRALESYIDACKENELQLQVSSVTEQVQFLIRESGGDVRKAVELIDNAIDEEREIC